VAERAQAAPQRATGGTAADASPLRLTSGGRIALVLVSAAALALALGTWLTFLWAVFHGPFGQYDFSSYYAAAAALRADPHADIYAAAVMARNGAATHVQVQPPLPYTYPPLLAIALVPLTLLPFHIAARVWTLGNVALWLGCALILGHELRRLLRPALAISVTGNADLAGWRGLWQRTVADPSAALALAVAAVLFLPFAPAQQTVLTGQMNFLVLLPLAVIPMLTRGRHERRVGAAVALAAMLKFTPALLLVYLALRRRWEALIAALLTLAALAVASIAVVGPGAFFAAVPEALHVGTGDARLGHNEALFAPVLNALLAVAPALAPALRVVEYALLAVLALALGWAIVRAGHSGSRSPSAAEDLAYALALCGLPLLAPAAWAHHYVWVLPAVALLLGVTARAALEAASVARQRAAGALLGCVVLAALALGWFLPYNWDTEPTPATSLLFGLPLRTLALELRSLGTLALVIVAIVLLRRGRIAVTGESRTTS
jgi:alpha-1,2-mannosyltransferase